MDNTNTHTFQFPALLSSLPDIDQEVAHLLWKAGLSTKIGNEISLVLEEVLTNIIKYAYSDPENRVIDLKICFLETKLMIVICDRGVAFDPTKIPSPDTNLSVDERNVGGLGIFLVKELMDRIEYQRANHQNILTIEKNI